MGGSVHLILFKVWSGESRISEWNMKILTTIVQTSMVTLCMIDKLPWKKPVRNDSTHTLWRSFPWWNSWWTRVCWSDLFSKRVPFWYWPYCHLAQNQKYSILKALCRAHALQAHAQQRSKKEKHDLGSSVVSPELCCFFLCRVCWPLFGLILGCSFKWYNHCWIWMIQHNCSWFRNPSNHLRLVVNIPLFMYHVAIFTQAFWC